MTFSRVKEILHDVFPANIFKYIALFSLTGVLIAQSIINAQNTEASFKVDISLDAQSGDYIFTLSGSYFTPNSGVRVGGVDYPTTFVDSTKIFAVIPSGQLSSGSKVSVKVVNYPSYSTYTVHGSNFTRNSVVRVNNKTLPTKFVSANELTADISSLLPGDYDARIFDESRLISSKTFKLTIPASSKPLTFVEKQNILQLARTAGISADTAGVPEGSSLELLFYANLADQATAKTQLFDLRQRAFDLSDAAKVPIKDAPAPGSPSELDFYTNFVSSAQAKLDFLELKNLAIALAKQAKIAVAKFPKDTDSGAKDFYINLKSRAGARLKVVEIKDAIFKLAEQAGVSIPTLPAPGTAGELDFYLDIERRAKENLKALGR